MSHQLNRCNSPAQKAGQAVGAALPLPLLPRISALVLREGTASPVPKKGPKRWASAPEVCIQLEWLGPRRWRTDHQQKRQAPPRLHLFAKVLFPPSAALRAIPCKGFAGTAF